MAEVEQNLWVSSMPSLHRLVVKPRVVDRVRWLENLAAARDIIHLGFVDVDRVEDKAASGTWLHDRLSLVAKRSVGIDRDPAGVAHAAERGHEAYVCDLQDPTAVASLGLAPAELVIAGELIEHLDCPGLFLEAVKPLVASGGRLVLTTPNAISFTNVLVALSRREWSSPYHVGMYSWRTLASLLERRQWSARDVLFYRRGPRTGVEAQAHPRLAKVFNAYERAARVPLRAFPLAADGLIVVAEPWRLD
jgi:2-polyprenyl-3-methyl-5-hydroxy-6-metoxy-1,4-benzoquinol methylase